MNIGVTGPDSSPSMGEDLDKQTGPQSSKQLAPHTAGPGPVPGCQSLKSSASMAAREDFKRGQQLNERIRPEKPEEYDLCSLKSWKCQSMHHPLLFKDQEVSLEESEDEQSPSSVQQHQTDRITSLQLFEGNVKTELRKILRILNPDEEKYQDDEEELKCEDQEMRSCREDFLIFAVKLLRCMKKEELADVLWRRTCAFECGERLKKSLRMKFSSVFEGVPKPGKSAPLNNIFTELFITEGGTDQVNQEHEIQKIEAATRNQTRSGPTIKQEDLFKVLPDRQQPIRCLLLKGVAGIGKTLLTQKLTLDWAEDKGHQNFRLLFPLSFRELNMLKENLSLEELLHVFFPEIKETSLSNFDPEQVLFIFDGLDESRVQLNFLESPVVTDVTQSASVYVLLTNLIRGKLLPSARVLVTTRPAAANQIPAKHVDMVTEVRGFVDSEKEKYFRRRFGDGELTSTIISHIKSSQSLYIMCHIPIFCWITAVVLDDMMRTEEMGELPQTLTEMYIYFLVVQLKVMKLKYEGAGGTDTVWDPDCKKMIESLGKLGFEQLQRGNMVFYESDLTECGIDVKAPSLYSGVITQIFREERGLYQEKVFCFIHLSFQEFLAALYVHQTFINSGVNLLEPRTSTLSTFFGNKLLPEEFYWRAINVAVESPNGHLDLFLRFLLGLSLEKNQSLLQGLLTPTQTKWSPAKLIKKKISEIVSPERYINLFHCLSEVRDTSLVEKVLQQQRSGRLSIDQLSPAQWSTLAFILLSSEGDRDVFDLKKYSTSEVALVRLLPVAQASNEVLLNWCELSDRSCSCLSSALSSPSCCLTQLDLSYNQLFDSGMELLSAGLKSPHCRLDILRLIRCELSEKSCSHLSSVLSSPSSRLKQLYLGYNNLFDSGVTLLSAGLKTPDCHLETLSLLSCWISERGCASLASALTSNPSHLKVLELSCNRSGGAGLDRLSAGLESPDWSLKILRVDYNGQRSATHWRKFFTRLSLDPDSAHQRLLLSNNDTTVRLPTEDHSFSDYLDIFQGCPQVIGRSAVTDVCYWEVEWRGSVSIAVTLRRDGGEEGESEFGQNRHSWSLSCSDSGGYKVCHDKRETVIEGSEVSHRVGVLVNFPEVGTLVFYKVTHRFLIPLCTFITTSGPLYPGFGLRQISGSGSSVTLCDPSE